MHLQMKRWLWTKILMLLHGCYYMIDIHLSVMLIIFNAKCHRFKKRNLETTKKQPVRQWVSKTLCQKIKKNIYASISKSYEEKVSRNREIILRIIDIVVVLGQQNIMFRGHTWNKETKSENGNFTRFVRWSAEVLR